MRCPAPVRHPRRQSLSFIHAGICRPPRATACVCHRIYAAVSEMVPLGKLSASEVTAVGLSLSVALLFSLYARRKAAITRPSAEEQAWLDAQLATPMPPESCGKLSQDEQKWLEASSQTF